MRGFGRNLVAVLFGWAIAPEPQIRTVKRAKPSYEPGELRNRTRRHERLEKS